MIATRSFMTGYAGPSCEGRRGGVSTAPNRSFLEAFFRRGRALPVRRAVDAVAIVRFRALEPEVGAQPVFGHHFDIEAFVPRLLHLRVQRRVEVLVLGPDADDGV